MGVGSVGSIARRPALVLLKHENESAAIFGGIEDRELNHALPDGEGEAGKDSRVGSGKKNRRNSQRRSFNPRQRQMKEPQQRH